MSSLEKPIYLTNTKSHQKELFRPLEAGKVKMYSCGPTVYGPIHIGNLRAALTADMFYRFFKRFGFKVTYVRNYTDIDDKIIKRANDEKTTMDVITKRYIQEVEKDYALAGMEEPTAKTLVTEHLPEIISMIEAILKNEKAYVSKEGEVFFSIPDFKTYGELSRKPLEDLQAGARVEVNQAKKNPMDFSLWKPAKAGEPSWDSPWGKGRPGWHIECSAMACKHLGPQMDLHHGGEDLVFPHHENEIAQSEAATGVAPYVNYWVHNAFLNFSNEKMSKSLGNIVSARDFLAQYGAELARIIFLGVHYRSILNFTPESVDQGVQSLEKIYEAKKIALEIREKKISMPNPMGEQVWGSFVIECERRREAILDHLANDLNTPGVMAEIFTLIREWNRALANPGAANTPTAIIAANEFIKVLEQELGAVMGIGRAKPESMLAQLSQVRVLRKENEGEVVLGEVEIKFLLEERNLARKNKDFKRSDEVRDHLLKHGISIKDTPTGETIWSRK